MFPSYILQTKKIMLLKSLDRTFFPWKTSHEKLQITAIVSETQFLATPTSKSPPKKSFRSHFFCPPQLFTKNENCVSCHFVSVSLVPIARYKNIWTIFLWTSKLHMMFLFCAAQFSKISWSKETQMTHFCHLSKNREWKWKVVVWLF